MIEFWLNFDFLDGYDHGNRSWMLFLFCKANFRGIDKKKKLNYYNKNECEKLSSGAFLESN
jgi:hypothetical protein